jgi:T4 RnlA family RNA ligase
LLKDQEGVIYEKVDGSMIHFFDWKGDLRAATRMSCNTDQAKDALALANKTGIIDDVAQEVKDGFTPIFEYVAPNNQIVVQYPKPRLVYLHSRNRNTGEYRRSPVFVDRAAEYGFRFADIMGQLDKEEFEGYVALLESGLWVKCKCPWYLERHRAVDALMRPAYRLYEVVYQGLMDDLIATAPDRFKDKLRSIYTEAQLDLLHVRDRILALASSIKEKVGNVRKDYAIYAKTHHKDDFSFLMTAYDNRDPSEGIKKRLLEGYKTKHPNRLFAELEPEG